FLHAELLDPPGPRRRHGYVHFHGLEDSDAVAFAHVGTDRGGQLIHHARHGRRHRSQRPSPPATRWSGTSISNRKRFAPKHLPRVTRRSEELAPPPKAS